jgi:hypothetical protein
MMSRTGKTQDRDNIGTYMVGVPFTGLYRYIMNFQKNKTLQQNTEAFMLSIGITADEIAAIKANMLEEVK